MSKRFYGWKQSKSHSAKKYSLYHIARAYRPSEVDLRPTCPPVYDQGQLGSCVGNGVAGIIQFIQPDFSPSRLFIYYNARNMEGTIDQDVGCEVHDAIQTVVNQGICSELEWVYDINKFAEKPNENCYLDAKKDIITDYFNLENIDDIKNCLASGFPVVFGATLYESFESEEVAKTGIVPMPESWEKVVGGHCQIICGFNDETQHFIVRNSWGSYWAILGYSLMPYNYIEQYGSDFWTIRK